MIHACDRDLTIRSRRRSQMPVGAGPPAPSGSWRGGVRVSSSRWSLRCDQSALLGDVLTWCRYLTLQPKKLRP